ncbi:MAG: hypothetical protein WC823_06270 [Parcubacteria group bacterium]|jgi:hypothetical protein
MKIISFLAPGEPNRSKETIYLASSTVLGALMGFIGSALVEIKYIHALYRSGTLAYFGNNHDLFVLLQISFLTLGALGGFLAGRFWWRKIYVEKVWLKKRWGRG